MDQAGNLYGAAPNGPGELGFGIVFKLDPSGNETVLHAFISGSDGAFPLSNLLLDAAGNLYGMTRDGGTYGVGTVYKLDASGKETILYNFGATTDDANTPWGGLVMDKSGNLYGTTLQGGTSGIGTVFKLDTSGNETVLHSFSGIPDGAFPYAGLAIDAAGNLYGTTYGGGNTFYPNPCSGGSGCGTVYKVDTSGNETVLYRFNFIDGAQPFFTIPVLDQQGNIYGTTSNGGSGNVGVVFKLNTSGNETVLHTFPYQGVVEGDPVAGLVMDKAGNLYGTTTLGPNSGTVFKIDTSGNETVLHDFTGLGTGPNGIGVSIDGAVPESVLIIDKADSNLYGTTFGGGAFNRGTVFKLTLPVSFSAFSAQLTITGKHQPAFDLLATFTLGAGRPPLDPPTEQVILDLGTFSTTIPAGSFVLGKHGKYTFTGTIDYVNLQVTITPLGGTSYEIKASGTGVNLTSQTNPVDVKLNFGVDTGETSVTARFR